MAITFLTLQQELADRLGMDQTITANQTRLKRTINLIQQDISARNDWKFLNNREIVQTSLVKTDGTVAITNGSTTITGTSTLFAATDVDSYIQFQDSTNWYVIATRSSATSITLEQAITESTASGLTYRLVKVYYDVSVNVDRILDIRQSNTPYKLTNLGYRTYDVYQPDMQTTGTPTAYYTFRYDPATAATSSKQLQFALFPIPDAQYNLEIRFERILSDLSADGDISLIPQKWMTVLLDGAEWLMSKQISDPNQENLKKAYEYGVSKMIEEENSLLDHHPVLQPSDNNRRTLFIPFPSTFEQQ